MKCRGSAQTPAPCKQRPPTHIKPDRPHGHPEGGEIIHAFATVIRSFLCLIQISAFYGLLCRIIYCSESDGHPQRRGATVVVGIAVVVDIASISGIARTHGKQPPVGPAQNIQRITYIFTSFSVLPHPSSSSACRFPSASDLEGCRIYSSPPAEWWPCSLLDHISLGAC